MSKPLLLDLFCCQGGASAGYVRAGFDVVGVDIAPQRHYPFTFVQADALDYLRSLLASGELARFAAIHASPPCQEYSTLKSMKTRQYPDLLAPTRDLLAPTRDLLMQAGLPWVLENVATAKMAHGTVICGTALGLNVRRHRRFDSSQVLWAPGPCRHDLDNINVYGRHAWNYRPMPDEWRKAHPRSNGNQTGMSFAAAKVAFETPWMTGHGMSECIPPAYTEWIGRQLLAALDAGKVA